MRIYVFGDDRDVSIELANRLNESGVSAIIGNNSDIAHIASKVGRDFDYAIMISDNPIEASIAANKEPKIKAAVCYSQKIIKNALNSRVNMLILDQNTVDAIDIEDIFTNGAKLDAPQKTRIFEERKEQLRQTQPEKIQPQPK